MSDSLDQLNDVPDRPVLIVGLAHACARTVAGRELTRTQYRHITDLDQLRGWRGAHVLVHPTWKQMPQLKGLYGYLAAMEATVEDVDD